MFTQQKNYTTITLKKQKYLCQLFSLQAQARRMNNFRVVIALQVLIDEVAMRGLRLN
jgi:hypothetical protein